MLDVCFSLGWFLLSRGILSQKHASISGACLYLGCLILPSGACFCLSARCSSFLLALPWVVHSLFFVLGVLLWLEFGFTIVFPLLVPCWSSACLLLVLRVSRSCPLAPLWLHSPCYFQFAFLGVCLSWVCVMIACASLPFVYFTLLRFPCVHAACKLVLLDVSCACPLPFAFALLILCLPSVGPLLVARMAFARRLLLCCLPFALPSSSPLANALKF